MKISAFEEPEYDRGGNARGGARYAAGKRAENAIFVHCFDCAHRERIAETGQRNGRASTGEIDQRLVNAQRCQNYAGNNEKHENSRAGELCGLNQYLSDDADQPADQKRF